MNLPKKVTIVDVGPRDGFQNEKQFIPTQKKIDIVNGLTRAGLKNIQVSSVVHPKAVPQLADAEEVMTKINRCSEVSYRLLVPNLKGAQRALPLKPDKIDLMMSVTESHNRSNANRSIEKSLKEFETLIPMILEKGIAVSGGMACGFGCPFEGKVSLRQIERVADRYVAMGITCFGLADTVGFASPKQVYDTVAYLLDKYPDVQWLLHLHNHRDLALANILAAMQAGITRFDAAIGGLGGCPYAPNAAGNVATEDLVNMLDEMGIACGVNLDALLEVAEVVRETIPHPLNSGLLRAGKPWVLATAPDYQIKLGLTKD
jgi:hydroxymethylglutaryl-CoA lyase